MPLELPDWAQWVSFIASVIGGIGSVLVTVWALRLSTRLMKLEESRDHANFEVRTASPRVLGTSFNLTIVNLGSRASSIEYVKVNAVGANGQRRAASLQAKPNVNGPWTTEHALRGGEIADVEMVVNGTSMDLEDPRLYPLALTFRLKPLLGNEVTYQATLTGHPHDYAGGVSRFF